jgi:3-methylcrotonyl-CoA carboxylase alpha subunit
MFRKVLVANRGEIAVRVVQACQELGIRAVAVYSEADRDALHVARADEAYPIGPAPAAESYLNIPRLVETARRCGAEAVHPGYGFLSENADFAAACEAAGLVFIGPPPDALRLLGDKAAAKGLARAARVPVVPGYEGAAQGAGRLVGRARHVGFPVLIKAVAGGGGRGMRRAASADEFPTALAQAQREARAAFGDDRVLLERDLTPARHVEVQFLADRHGAALAVGERDCSVQRRHQKLVEEAPAPGLESADRARLGRWAVRLAETAGYVGAGTAEFLRDAAGHFYFLEVNARLQVEHPVTELVYGIDLVHWQLRIAAGEPLTLRPADVRARGHAIEARLYAEDPADGFRPCTGTIERFAPPLGPGLRHDVGVRAGDRVSRYYDTLLAKLIAYGVDREAALARLAWALRRYVVQGLPTNQALLLAVATEPDFRAVRLSTDFFDRHPDLLRVATLPPAALWAAVAADLVGIAGDDDAAGARAPWAAAGPWRGRSTPVDLRYLVDGGERVVAAEPRQPGAWSVRLLSGGTPDEHALEAARRGEGLVVRVDGQTLDAHVLPLAEPPGLQVQLDGDTYLVRRPPPPAIPELSDGGAASGSGDGAVRAPTVGVVVAVHVAAGESVREGQPLVAIEAMKIEQNLVAPRDSQVRRVHCHVGDNVASGTLLVELE